MIGRIEHDVAEAFAAFRKAIRRGDERSACQMVQNLLPSQEPEEVSKFLLAAASKEISYTDKNRIHQQQISPSPRGGLFPALSATFQLENESPKSSWRASCRAGCSAAVGARSLRSASKQESLRTFLVQPKKFWLWYPTRVRV
jgi:hypothetical protein